MCVTNNHVHYNVKDLYRQIQDKQRITQFLDLLTDKMLRWATVVWEKVGESLCFYDGLSDPTLGGKTVGE